ncbi:MAG: hypothetical protein CSA50_02550 [Gammaproteobacteria bacterium]|nr:MAG: hypothetical protein CSA50_02550 [Gammaproteobacteria bacterium]
MTGCRTLSVFKHLIILLVLLPGLCLAQDARLSLSQDVINPATHTLYFEDKTNTITIDKILQKPNSIYTPASPEQNLNFGYSDSTYWIKIPLTNDTEEPVDRLIEVGYAILDHVAFFLVVNGVPKDYYYTGDNRPFSQRPYPHQSFVFPIQMPPGEQAELYIKVHSSSSLQVPLTIWSPREFHLAKQNESLAMGLIIGCLLAMACFSFFLFTTLGARYCLFYSLYLGAVSMFFLTVSGLGYRLFWPFSAAWNDNAVLFFVTSFLLFSGLFMYDFLAVRHMEQRKKKVVQAYLAFAVLVWFSSLSAPYFISIKLVIIVIVFTGTISLWIGISKILKGDKAARYFTAGGIVVVAGGLLLVGNKIGLFPRTAFTENTLFFTTAIQSVLLSLAIAKHQNQEQEKRFFSQKQLLTQERELVASQQLALHNERKSNQKHRNSFIRQQQSNEILEQKIRQRTAELEDAYQQIKDMASRDPLTGVKNRTYLDEQFYSACKHTQKNRATLSVAMIDIDHFKTVNDKFGHTIGDKCLIAVTRQIVKAKARANNLVARYSGETFCILLPMTTQADALEIAENIRRNIETMTCNFNDIKISMTVSVGIATVSHSTVAGAFKLLDHAEQALKQAKKLGRNKVCVWQEQDPVS